jgi:hypothetical protein
MPGRTGGEGGSQPVADIEQEDEGSDGVHLVVLLLTNGEYVGESKQHHVVDDLEDDT